MPCNGYLLILFRNFFGLTDIFMLWLLIFWYLHGQSKTWANGLILVVFVEFPKRCLSVTPGICISFMKICKIFMLRVTMKDAKRVTAMCMSWLDMFPECIIVCTWTPLTQWMMVLLLQSAMIVFTMIVLVTQLVLEVMILVVSHLVSHLVRLHHWLELEYIVR